MKLNRIIKVSIYKNCTLYLDNFLSKFCEGLFVGECFHKIIGMKKKRTQLMFLFDKGEQDIEKHLDIIKIIRTIKKFNIINKPGSMLER
jgi:hypothetical protein